VIEKANGNFSTYSPDLPGCVATGTTRAETERCMHEAIQMHIQGMKEEGMSIPQQKAIAEYIAVSAKELKVSANSG
jgi:predicted RNase H-like HicB family nuclease